MISIGDNFRNVTLSHVLASPKMGAIGGVMSAS
jgi:hypothetical protein